MTRVYDNWERLVEAVLKREQLRLIALAPSRDPSFRSSISADSNPSSSLKVEHLSGYMAVGYIFTTPIKLANQVMKAVDDAALFKLECVELKSKTQTLAWLLHQAARVSNSLYDRPRPMNLIVEETERVLNEALALVLKCSGVRRVLNIIRAAAFRKVSYQLENSIGDVSWLLRVAASADDRANEYLGLPPIAAREPILSFIWVQIVILYTGSIEDKGDAAASLVSLARDSDENGKLIIKEGGVGPLLKLVKEGKLEGQENAAMAIGLLGKDPESVEHIIDAGVCSVFVEILKEGPMKVQAVVAWAVSELALHYPICQDLFAQHYIIQLLVGHLAFETLQEHSKYLVVREVKTIYQLVLASKNIRDAGANDGVMKGNPLGDKHPNKMHNLVTSTMALKGSNGVIQSNLAKADGNNGAKYRAREMEDPSTKAYIKAMAARALWQLAKGNSTICQSITETIALLCLAVLLEKGPVEVQYNSAMALMEITAVAEKDADLRRSAFRSNSPACKAVVDQLCRVIEKADSEVLVPCIKAIGNLARSFSATGTRMISPLVMLLTEQEAEVSREACIALTKFAGSSNYLARDHSKAIIGASGAKPLVRLVYSGEQIVQSCALILLCYIALHMPDNEELSIPVLPLLEWASKQESLMQAEDVEELLTDTKLKLELFQSRGHH